MESIDQLLFLKVSSPLPHGSADHSTRETGGDYRGLKRKAELHDSSLYRLAIQSPGEAGAPESGKNRWGLGGGASS